MKFVPLGSVDTPAQSAYETAKAHKARMFKLMKSLRERIKTEPMRGNAHGLRLELLKATSAHNDAIRYESEARKAIEAAANAQGLTTRRQPRPRSS